MPAFVKFFGYKLTIEPSSDDSEIQSLKDILDNPVDDPHPLQRAGNVFTFDGKIIKKRGLYTGTFSLVQTVNIPTKAKIGEAPEDLFADEDDDTVGLGHYTSFIYDPTHDIIMIQSNKNGVTANGIVAFFKRNYDIGDAYAEVLISKEDLRRIEQFGIISSFELSIAKPSDAGDFGNAGNQTFQQMAGFADAVEANTMRIHIGMGYQRTESLRKNRLLATIRSLLQIRPQDQHFQISKLEVRGRETDESGLETLDLVSNRAKIIVSLDHVRSYNPAHVERLIIEAVDEYMSIRNTIPNCLVKNR